MCNGIYIQVPNSDIVLTPGCKVKLHRFDAKMWILKFGWFSFGGNRPFCGWYMEAEDDCNDIRPLQKPDLLDIYLIKH